MGTKSPSGRIVCDSEAGEPIFVLYAGDPEAPALVEEWADRREASGEAGSQIDDARECAILMRDWRVTHPFVRRPCPMTTPET